MPVFASRSWLPRTVRSQLVRLVPCAALLLLVSCVSEKREQEFGDLMAADVNAHLPLVRDPILNAYVSGVGRVISSVSQRPHLDYRFYIINSASVNAFALPGGHVYLTRGLIEQTRSGPELAAVLAHEIGHVAARHGVQKMQRHLRTGSVVSVLYNLILGGEPEILQQNALQLSGMLWSASHSREDEEQADELAVEYLARAGVDPQAMVRLLRTLVEAEERDSGDAEIAAWFSSHPLTRDRLAATEQKIRDEQKEIAAESALEISSYPTFLRRVAALPPPIDRP